MTEDLTYREVRGVMATGGKEVAQVTIFDGLGAVKLDTPYGGAWLKPNECRSLARDLRRLARRIDARKAGA